MSAFLKLLLTILVILVVYWVVKFRGRTSVLKAAVNAAQKTMKKTAAGETKGVPVSLVACPKCGTYNAVGAACACTPKQPT